MEDEIIRKVSNRTNYLARQFSKSPKCNQNVMLRERLPFKNGASIKPLMQSTPLRNKRRKSDEGYYTPINTKEKYNSYQSGLIENLTPIRSQASKRKHGIISQDMTTFGTNKTNIINRKKAFDVKNMCNESFDSGVFKSPPSTQTKMLSLDDSLLQAIDVDVAARKYWDSKKQSTDTKIRKLKPEDQRGSPDFFVDSDEEILCIENALECSDEKMKRATESKNCIPIPMHNLLLEECPEDECMIGTNVVNVQSEKNKTDALTDDLQSIELNWDNDSMLNAAVLTEDKASLFSDSPVSSGASLGDKIRRALITNVQKPVTHKPRSLDLNGGSIEQNVSTSNGRVAFFDIGPFFGLPSKVKTLIQKSKGIKDLYMWQKECLSLNALQEKKNLIYALPTSGGKTLVAEILMLRELMCYKKNAIFILPYVSIVQEKVRSLAPFGLEFDFFVEEYAAGKGQYPPRKRRKRQTIYVATIEKALGLVNSLIEAQRLDEIGLVVVDEIHLIGDDNGRGCTLEGLLTKLLYVQGGVQIVGMSATIGNVYELACFLKAEIYTQDFRPVELKEYVKCEDKLYSVNWSSKSSDDLLVFERKLSFSYSAAQTAVDPDCIGGLVLEVVPQNSCLVFCPTKKNCENVAQLICSILPSDIMEHKKNEKRALFEALKSDGSGAVCSVLRKILQFGIAYHHSGLTSDEKRLIEEAFQIGTLCCICCTSTLAAGVNLPAKRVILRAPYVGRDFINLSRYKQMVGRAGRAGFGEIGESILLCKTSDTRKVGELLRSPMDEVVSSLHLNDGHGLQNLLLSSVGLGIATTRKALQQLSSSTLLSVQASRLEVDLQFLVDKIISQLIRLKALRTTEPEKSSPNSSCSVNSCNISVHILNTPENDMKKSVLKSDSTIKSPKRTVYIKNSTELKVSRLGKAAIKGCIQLSRAHMLYEDLLKAQSSLVLLTCLHLLYLVTPYDLVSLVKPNNFIYFSVYNKMGSGELETAKVLGITEVCMARLMNGLTVKSVPERVLNRFYLTLMLYKLWNQKSVWEVSNEFEVPRGFVQTLMTSAAAFSASVMRFCEEISEFWAFKELLVNFSQQLSHCCTAELLPLMDLPAVKKGRARQLHKAGYKTLQLVANADPSEMVKSIDHMPKRVASQIIAAAKLLLKQKADSLREEAEEVMEGLET